MASKKDFVDRIRVRAHGSLARIPGGLGDRLRGLNEALGRPLASHEEIVDRRAFENGAGPAPAVAPPAATAPSISSTAGVGKVAAPVVVYHLDKHRGQLSRLTQPLDAAEIPYRVLSLEGDLATQSAVRRDSGGRKLPLIFIAGECVGGREELHQLERSGLLKKKVWG
jgi:glutaredoxin